MSSIPLPALSVQPPPQQQSPIQQEGQLLELQSLLGQQKLQQAQLSGEQQQQQQRAQLFTQQLRQQQIETQKAQIGLKDQQGMSQALLDSYGKGSSTGTVQEQGSATGGSAQDRLGSFMNAVQDPKYGISAQGQMGVMQQFNAMREQVAKTDKATLDATQEANNQFVAHLGTVLKVAPEDQAAQWTLQRNAIMRDPTLAKYGQQIPAQYPGPQQATTLLHSLMLNKDLLDTLKSGAELPGEIATSAKAQQEAAMTPQQRAAVGSPELQAMDAWLAKNPGKDASDYAIMMKKLVPQFNLNMQQGLLGGSAMDLAAQNYLQTGQMPQGMRSPGMSSAIINRAGEMAKQNPELANLASNRAAYAANKTSLDSLQKNFDQVNAFENTAGKNLDQFLNTAKKVVDSGSPWVNTPLRLVAQQGLGSTDQAAFNAARQTALTEIAKVLSSSNASGVLSDSARGEVSQLIGPNASLKQIYSAANILKQDMQNRHDSYQQQISDIKGRFNFGGQGAGAPAPQQSVGHKIGDTITQNGHDFKVTAVDANGKVTAAQ